MAENLNISKVDVIAIAADLIGPDATGEMTEYERGVTELVSLLVSGTTEDKEGMHVMLRFIAEKLD